MATTKEGNGRKWLELGQGAAEFQRILQLLVEYDERTGRSKRCAEPHLHLMRKAIALAPTEEVRIYACALGGFVYSLAAELQSACGRLATAWIHEDGIRLEREQFSDPSHPVHSIVCLTDLLADARPACFEGARAAGEQVQLLMLDDTLYSASA